MADEREPTVPAADPSRLGGWIEAQYRWLGWATGLLYVALAWATPNVWLGAAAGLFGVCHLANWVTDRVEAARGRTLLRARYTVAALWFAAVPVLAIVGVAVWVAKGIQGR